jgi:folate-binding protein YgfZ
VTDVTPGFEGYAEAASGSAVFEQAGRGLLEATGPQRQKFLQGMLSNEVAGLKPGEGRLAALLDVKGHVRALMRALVAENTVRLELPADLVEGVEQTLVFYKVAAPVRFARRPVSVFGLIGPTAGQTLTAAGAELPGEAPESHRETAVAGHPVVAVRASDLPRGGFVLHVQPDDADGVRQALVTAGAASLGPRALDALRVEAGWPWYGVDVTGENLLHETGLVPQYCSFTKGCYIGQEVIARLDARGGNVNKRLRGLRLGAETTAGTPLLAEDREVGRVTTAALSPTLGPIALAYVHRSHAEPGSNVTVGGAPATVTALPIDGALAQSA